MPELAALFDELDAEVSFEAFEAAVAEKVEQLGGLADEETAARLVMHELGAQEAACIGEITAAMEEVQLAGKVMSIGELRSFDRDEEEEPGHVLNVELADESGRVRAAMWDGMARDAAEQLSVGDVLQFRGRPKDGFNGVEVDIDGAEPTTEVDFDVDPRGRQQVGELSLGRTGVQLVGEVLAVDSVRTFERSDGSEGRVANMQLGDDTGRVRCTMWDGMADAVETVSVGEVVEVSGGSVRDRDGNLELHVGEQGRIGPTDEAVTYVPDPTPIAALELGAVTDIAGGVIEATPKRTFDRDDGSEGQVRNIRLKDASGDIRVALWGEHADAAIELADYVVAVDVEVRDGWQEDLEASAGWRSSLTVRDPPAQADAPTESATLSGFGEPDEPADDAAATGPGSFTGTVVQVGSPVILDDGTATQQVETDATVRLGEQLTVHGEVVDGRLHAEQIERV